MISRNTKQDTFKGDEDRLLEDDVKTNAFEIASNQKNLFTKSDEAEEMEAEVRIYFEISTRLVLPLISLVVPVMKCSF